MNPIPSSETITILYSEWKEAATPPSEDKAGEISSGQQRLLVQWLRASESILSPGEIAEVLMMAQTDPSQPIDALNAVKQIGIINPKTASVIDSLSKKLLGNLSDKGSNLKLSVQSFVNGNNYEPLPDWILHTSPASYILLDSLNSYLFPRGGSGGVSKALANMTPLEKKQLPLAEKVYSSILSIAAEDKKHLALPRLMQEIPVAPTNDPDLNRKLLLSTLAVDSELLRQLISNGFRPADLLDAKSIASKMLANSHNFLAEERKVNSSADLDLFLQDMHSQERIRQMYELFTIYAILWNQMPESTLLQALNMNIQGLSLRQVFNRCYTIPECRSQLEHIVQTEALVDPRREAALSHELQALIDELWIVRLLYPFYDDPTIRLNAMLGKN